MKSKLRSEKINVYYTYGPYGKPKRGKVTLTVYENGTIKMGNKELMWHKEVGDADTDSMVRVPAYVNVPTKGSLYGKKKSVETLMKVAGFDTTGFDF